MPLTVAEVRNAKKREKPYKLADGGGLYLYVSTAGTRSWRMKYRIGKTEKLLTFGLAEDVGLVEARGRREEAKAILRAGRDPGAEREKAKQDAADAGKVTFEPVARAWHDAELPRWSPGQAKRVLRALERDVFQAMGPRPIADITGPEILKVLRKVEDRGAIETAKRIRGYIADVFKRAKSEHFVTVNPAIDIADALRRTPKNSKQPAITDPDGLIELQRAVDRSTSGATVKLASRLLALTVVRVGVLRAAPWTEFVGIDWDKPDEPTPNAVWRIPAGRMKLEIADKDEAGYDHDVPLVPQAVAILRALHVLTGRGVYLFPSQKSARVPMSDAALSALYKRRGYRGLHVPHGWRAAFSTIMNEHAVEMDREGDRLVVDLMLAHVPKGMSASEFAYNRARYAKRRRELASVWADLMTAGLIDPAELVHGKAR